MRPATALIGVLTLGVAATAYHVATRDSHATTGPCQPGDALERYLQTVEDMNPSPTLQARIDAERKRRAQR